MAARFLRALRGSRRKELLPSRVPSAASWGVVSRNIDRASRRWPRLLASPIADEMGPITLLGGTALHLPSDDEKNAPELPPGAPALYPRFGSCESSPDSDSTSGLRTRRPNCQTQKISGDDLVASLP